MFVVIVVRTGLFGTGDGNVLSILGSNGMMEVPASSELFSYGSPFIGVVGQLMTSGLYSATMTTHTSGTNLQMVLIGTLEAIHQRMVAVTSG